MSSRIPVIAIVGRTNVGKSTLFNTLAGRRLSIVEDQPGVTRDRHYAFVRRGDFHFSLIDTGGLVGEEDNPLASAVRLQAELAIAEADLIICLFDGIAGLHPQDPEVARMLRRCRKPVLWVVNKCESVVAQQGIHEFYALGLDDVRYISAAHRVGCADLIEACREALGIPQALEDQRDGDEQAPEEPVLQEEQPIRLAILGKPNSGKSTLINRLLGQDRLVVSELAGTTRDAIQIRLRREGQDYLIFDTAGLRRKNKIEDLTVERYSNLRALRALAMSDVAVLLIDATDGLPSAQDEKIAGLVHERGRGLIIAVNKWDAVEKDGASTRAYEEALRQVLKFAPYAPVVFVSGLTGRRCPSILAKAREVYEASKVRIPTGELNRVLSRAMQRRTPPAYRGELTKLLYATQTGVQPPEFVLFFNHIARLNFSYERYLKNSIREAFPFPGSDIRLTLKKRPARGRGKRKSAQKE